MRRLVLMVGLLAALAPAAAHARRPFAGWGGAGSLKLEAGWDTQPALDGGGERAHRGWGAIGGRTVFGKKKSLQFAAGIDLRLGFEVPGAFVYDFAMLPIGVGLRFGKRGMLGVIAGGGVSGATGHAPFSWTLPIEAFAGVDLGRRVRFHVAARVSFVTAAARQDGAADAPFGDELELRAGISWGRREDDWGMSGGDGDYLGGVYRQQQGEEFAGVTLALAIDVAGAP